ncbi:hypothetical protein IAT38_007888 [Cryptococcus sp. DSM 104549]
MATKYRGLPDIDTAPDVFETVDEPETVLKPSESGLGDEEAPIKPTSEAIDANGLPSRRKAERVFARGTRRLDTSTLSFRPRLPPLPRYGSSSSDSDEPSPSVPRESAAARLRRLKAELAEVEAEIGSSSATTGASTAGQEAEGKRRSVLPPRKPVDVVAELTSVRERLERIELDGEDVVKAKEPAAGSTGVGAGGGWKERLERLVTAEQRKGEVKPGGREETGGAREATGLSGLDKRLALIEEAVGPIGDGLDQATSAPLLSTLNKHDHLLTLLTQPRHLDAISRRVKLLLVDLDRAAAASRRTGPGGAPIPSQAATDKAATNITLSQAEYAQLLSLFSVLPRLDPLLPILAPVLARLRSLAGLHAEASDVAEGLRRLQTKDKREREEVKELGEVVKSVQNGVADAAVGMQKNWEGLEGRMLALEKRLKDLETN